RETVQQGRSRVFGTRPTANGGLAQRPGDWKSTANSGPAFQGEPDRGCPTTAGSRFDRSARISRLLSPGRQHQQAQKQRYRWRGFLQEPISPCWGAILFPCFGCPVSGDDLLHGGVSADRSSRRGLP